MLDVSLISTKTSDNAAIIEFVRDVNIEEITLTSEPNKTGSAIYWKHRKSSIGVRNLEANSEYTVCLVVTSDTSHDMQTINGTSMDLVSEPLCMLIETNTDAGPIKLLVAELCAGLVGGIVFTLILYELCKMCFENRELHFYNIAQENEELLENTVYSIMEQRLNMSDARQILLLKVFRRSKKNKDVHDDIKTRPVIAYFKVGRERRSVLRHARSSSKVNVDGIRILLPPGAGY